MTASLEKHEQKHMNNIRYKPKYEQEDSVLVKALISFIICLLTIANGLKFFYKERTRERVRHLQRSIEVIPLCRASFVTGNPTNRAAVGTPSASFRTSSR